MNDEPNKTQKNLHIFKVNTINGVKFTIREMDILACLASGRRIKIIASLLSISPKTVESHIYNIMRKLDCNSQESIINFIERSGKFVEIRQIYLDIVTFHAFIQSLNEFVSLIRNEVSSPITIFVEKGEQTREFIQKLGEIFKRLGILKTIHFKNEVSIFNNKDINFIKNYKLIYIVSEKFFKKVAIPNLIGKSNDSGKYLIKGIYLIVGQSNEQIDLKNFSQVNYIDFRHPNDQYLNFFQLLSKLCPVSRFESGLEKLKQQFHDIQHSLEKTDLEEKFLSRVGSIPLDRHNNQNHSFFIFSKKLMVNIVTYFLLIVMILGGFIGILSYINKEKKHKFSVTRDYVVNTKGKVEKAQLKKEFEQQLNGKKLHQEKYIINSCDTTAINTSTWNLPSNIDHYVERKKLTEAIWDKLFYEPNNNYNHKNMRKEVILVGVYGLGGVGKTLLASHAINDPKQKYDFRGWFSAETAHTLIIDYLKLGEELNLYTQDMTEIQKINATIRWLESKNNILLVYDNAPDLESIKNYLPRKGHIIITSRNYKLPNSIKIDVMTLTEALDLLGKIIPKESKIEMNYALDAKELVERLGFLPLAISQAGAYIFENIISISTYLAYFKMKQKELLSRNVTLLGDKHEAIYITWDINLQKIKSLKHGLQAISLLNLMAYLYSENIPKDLLTHYIFNQNNEENNYELDQRIELLRRYSLIDVSLKAVSIHRLVQEWTRNHHSDSQKQKIMKDASFALQAIFPSNRSKSELDLIKYLLPHGEALLNNIDIDNDKISLISVLSDGYFELGYFEKSKNLILWVFEKAVKSKSMKPRVRTKLWRTLGRIYEGLGEHIKSRDINRFAVSYCREHFGNEHIETGRAIYTLSRAHIWLGEYNESLALAIEAVNIFNKIQNVDTNEKAALTLSMAWDYMRLGDYKKMHELAKKSLGMYDNDHHHIAEVKNCLGVSYCSLGNFKDCKSSLTEALRIYEQHHPLEHSKKAWVLNNIGLVDLYLGNLDESKQNLSKSINIFEKFYGNNHPLVSIPLTNMGALYISLGKLSESLQYLERAQLIQRCHYYFDYIWRVKTLIYLGLAKKLMGDMKKAEEYYKQALQELEKFYPKKHIFSNFIKAYLADLYLQNDLELKGRELIDDSLKNISKYYNNDCVFSSKISNITNNKKSKDIKIKKLIDYLFLPI